MGGFFGSWYGEVERQRHAGRVRLGVLDRVLLLMTALRGRRLAQDRSAGYLMVRATALRFIRWRSAGLSSSDAASSRMPRSAGEPAGAGDDGVAVEGTARRQDRI